MQKIFSVRNKINGVVIRDIITISSYCAKGETWLHQFYLHSLRVCKYGFKSKSDALNAGKEYIANECKKLCK